uniref:6-pyruvoyltetrahydropterin synthase n=1 Tax=Paulinella chromatophora TaxID=39717 RepID=B1X461_PAUCH|nr:6-pyruvoyl-tetrahydropterin synthase-like protein [Paulinella chromatophora]ACB42730.1 6-pyruvoyl-tetrahydropterin synthase-like protein [Paulinella chromatophora]
MTITRQASMACNGYGRSCVITRRANFSASHLYWLPELSDEENGTRFGLCSLRPGHGHNYELIVAVGGDLDCNGMVLNLSEVKTAIRSEVTDQLDFRFLNDCWADFSVAKPFGRLPTTEAITIAIWQRLIPLLPLRSLRLYEQSNLWADYLGKAMEVCLSIRTHFSAAHRLARIDLSQDQNENIYGKCARIHGHGHNYFLEITVRGNMNTRTGMVCDLAKFHKLVQDIIVEPFDHTFLNKDILHFSTCVPTAENIALHIADLLKSPILDLGVDLYKVHLQESPNNAAIVYVEKD